MSEVHFKNVIGHARQVWQLGQLLSRNTLPHALLFSGPESVGKRHCALALAEAMFALNSKRSADEISSLVRAGNHPDLHFLTREEEKKDISVDAIRELRKSLQMMPYLAGGNVAIINDAHQMNTAAANALLLTLEEPRPGNTLILVTHAAQRLPATILSRAQTIHFGELSEVQAQEILAALCPKIDWNGLSALTAEGLAPLEISQFIDPKTSKLSSPDKLAKHLHAIIARHQEIETRLVKLLGQKASIAECLAAVAELSAKSGPEPIFWQALRGTLRKLLRTHSGSLMKAYAEALMDAVRVEKSILERNFSAPTQLSNWIVGTTEKLNAFR